LPFFQSSLNEIGRSFSLATNIFFAAVAFRPSHALATYPPA
jgi:hypothetical protein